MLAAVLSWVDARAHGGRWLLRFEDVDRERCRDEFKLIIRKQLHAFGLCWDDELPAQSARRHEYDNLISRWQAEGKVYGCSCTRRDLAPFRGSGETRYPGTCRNLERSLEENSVRFRLPEDNRVGFTDRAMGPIYQQVSDQCGDIVLRRRTGDYTYQFAVSMDDAQQGITHVVRGEDLLESTGRQLLIMNALGTQKSPTYLHHPLLLSQRGEKLSKSTGALPLDPESPKKGLLLALKALELAPQNDRVLPDTPSCEMLLDRAIRLWQNRLSSSSGKIRFSCIATRHG